MEISGFGGVRVAVPFFNSGFQVQHMTSVSLK